MLLHLVSANQDDPLAAYREVRKEIEAFGHGLNKKREIIIRTKIDLVSLEECATIKKLLTTKTDREVLLTSVEEPTSLKAFVDKLSKILSKQ